MTREDEHERQELLRALLLHCRSRLQPLDVGLPQTAHRRVAGLRREEVAELAGVSADWYRAFECGKPIRVSVSFLARLSQALRLTLGERSVLFKVAIPELYEVETALDNRSIQDWRYCFVRRTGHGTRQRSLQRFNR